MKTRLRHLWLFFSLLPGLAANQTQRKVWGEMRLFCRTLPGVMKRPLSELHHHFTPTPQPALLPENTLRQLADATALLERHSPLGLCLRRSLTRYYFLRRAGVPVTVHFGAKFVPQGGERKITGHAWLSQNGRPYFEDEENWRDFTIMFSWPEE